ncbi:MAG: hypothetical protein VYD54_06150 [Bdellovibrionota bacterium]|nr:hypothetical protein [Bdellovibrionota bacterium]
MTNKSNKKRTYRYTIDEEGELSFEGSPLTDEKTISFFLRNLKPRPLEKEFLVICQGEENIVSCEDVPLVTTQLDFIIDPEEGLKKLILHFRGNITEELDPSTLEVGKKNILYFSTRNNQIRGRFSRKCYLQLADFIKEKDGHYYLEVNRQIYYIKTKPLK